MKFLLKLLIIIIFIGAYSSCTKPGIGGTTTVVCFLKHHSMLIINDSIVPSIVYVKFGATELPADPTNNYDAKFIGTIGEDHVHVIELKPGQYFLYGVGWDPDISNTVMGGLGIKVRTKDKTKEIDMDIPVTE